MKNGKLKKLLSVTLVAAMTAAMLIGCGSKPAATEEAPAAEETTEATEEAPAAEEATEEASGEAVTISIWRDTFNLASADSAEVTAVQDAINAYLTEQGKNFQIALTDIGSGEYKDKANLAVANGEVNLLWTASWIETINCDNLVKQGAVYDLTSILPGTDLYNSMPEGIWAASRYNGKDYYVPCYKESAEGYSIMYRSDLAEKFGWDFSNVKSIKDVEPMLADAKADGIKYPYLTQKTALFYRWALNDFDFFAQNSIMAVDRATDEVVCVVDTPQYKEFCQLMTDWAEKGYLSEDDLTKTTTDTTTQTQDWAISYWTNVPNNDEADTRYKQSVDMCQVTDNWAHSTTTLGSCFCVTSNSSEAQAKACVDFLGMLYTDTKLANLYTFGIEGTDYDVVDGFVVKKGDMYNHSAWESTSVVPLSLEQGEPENKVELYKTFNESAKTSSAAGFRFDRTPVESQWTACQTTVFDEHGYVLENGGATDVDAEIAAYKEALDGAGFQDVLAEAQAQYTAWKASK